MPSIPKSAVGGGHGAVLSRQTTPFPTLRVHLQKSRNSPNICSEVEPSPGQGHPRRGQGLSQPWGWMFSGRGGRSACAPISHPFCACAARCERLKEILIALLGENEPVNAAICCAKDSRPERFLLAAMIVWSRENELALPPQSDLHGGEVSEQQQSDYLGVRPCPSLEEMWV